MIFLKKTFLVKGLNQKILISRLKKSGITMLNIKILKQNAMEITIREKDCHKFFAICQNIWYNKLLRISGILAPFYKMLKNPIISVALLISLLMCFVFDNIFISTIYKDDAVFFKREIQESFENNNISKYDFFDENKLKTVENNLSKNDDIAFAKIEKWGNKAIIHIKRQIIPPKMTDKIKGNILAPEDIEILNISVYSGTAFFKNGDFVKKGQVIVSPYYEEDGKIVSCEVLAEISALFTYNFIYESKFPLSEADIEKAVINVKLGFINYPQHECKVEKINDKTIKITLKYEKNLCGG